MKVTITQPFVCRDEVEVVVIREEDLPINPHVGMIIETPNRISVIRAISYSTMEKKINCFCHISNVRTTKDTELGVSLLKDGWRLLPALMEKIEKNKPGKSKKAGG